MCALPLPWRRILEPEILIVDEVLAVGDFAFQKKCMDKMGKEARRGRTILFVSHNTLAVKLLCTTAVVLKSGVIDAVGSTEQCIAHYLDDNPSALAEGFPLTSQSVSQDSVVKLRRVRIFSCETETNSPTVDKPITVEVEYENLVPGRRLVSIHLFTRSEQTIFTSGNIPSASLTPDEIAQGPLDCGIYKTTCTIPPFFFNPGVHYARIFVYTGSPAEVFIDARHRFEVTETNRFRGEFFGDWLGAVRPLLAWKTQKVEGAHADGDQNRKD